MSLLIQITFLLHLAIQSDHHLRQALRRFHDEVYGLSYHVTVSNLAYSFYNPNKLYLFPWVARQSDFLLTKFISVHLIIGEL